MRILVILICILIITGNCKQPDSENVLLSEIADTHFIRISSSIGIYDYSQFNRLERSYGKYITGPRSILSDPLSDNKWEIISTVFRADDSAGSWDFDIRLILLKGIARSISAAIVFTFDNWSDKNYVLIPGAVYNGNRYPFRAIAYSPKLLDPRDIGPEKGIIISDIPRLSVGNEPSVIQIRTGNCALPGFCFFSPDTRMGFFLVTQQGNRLGDYGLSLEENRNKSEAVFRIHSPVVREKYKYKITSTSVPSDDLPADIQKGDTIIFSFRMYFCHINDMPEFYRKFLFIRENNKDTSPRKFFYSLSSCFSVVEDKFNRMNYVPEYGYYSVGMRENFLQDWQIGWTGGMISTWPLLMDGSEESKNHVINNFNWLFPDGVSPSGFFWDSGEKGNQWYGGDIRKPHTVNWHLVRKSGDGLFYILKQLEAMKLMGIPIHPEWVTGTRGVADAFCRVWQTQGQMGQFVNNMTGDVIVGGSTSGAIVPAALVRSSYYFRDKRYLDVAIEVAEYLYINYVSKGITCGGPGDALQCPDSESAYGMLESFMSLFEATGDRKWLNMAEEMACQFSSWVMTYDYIFPDTTLSGSMGIQSKGSVFANAQNNHGAPGICTYSGNALLRLYRATGKDTYADILQEICQFIPQNLSHSKRPIPGMEIGWLSERVNTNDWLEGIGEIMYGSTWSETSLMLTYTEIPGIYIRPDLGKIWVFDQLEVRMNSLQNDSLKVTITNPTEEESVVKVLVESGTQIGETLDIRSLMVFQRIKIPGRENKILTFKKKLDDKIH